MAETMVEAGFTIGASRAVLVRQTSEDKDTWGRTSSVQAVPVEQYLDGFFFVTVSFFQGNWITVIRKVDDPVVLDGVTLDKKLFLPASGGFEVAEIAMKPCPAAGHVCPHRISGNGVSGWPSPTTVARTPTSEPWRRVA